jgi:hypothetical protein
LQEKGSEKTLFPSQCPFQKNKINIKNPENLKFKQFLLREKII